MLLDGDLMQVGSPTEIFTSPESQKVAEIVGIENMFPGKVIEHQDKLLTIDVHGNHLFL